MKKTWNIIFCMLLMLLVSGYVNEKTVYAGSSKGIHLFDRRCSG